MLNQTQALHLHTSKVAPDGGVKTRGQSNNADDFGEIKQMIESLSKKMDDVNNKLDGLSNDINGLKQNQQEIKNKQDEHTERLEGLEWKMEQLEGHSKRNNLIFHGIADGENENWDDCEQKIRNVFSENLDLGEADIEIERAHRLNFVTSGCHPIIVKLQKFKDKQLILRNAKKLKDTDIFINEDYTRRVREIRKNLLDSNVNRNAKENGIKTYLKYDKLKVGKEMYRYNEKTANVVPVGKK